MPDVALSVAGRASAPMTALRRVLSTNAGVLRCGAGAVTGAAVKRE
jgi:hypothetical protein